MSTSTAGQWRWRQLAADCPKAALSYPSGVLLDQIRSGADELRSRYRLGRLAVFGSVARGEETAGSDLDVAVDFLGADRLFDRFMDLKLELETRFARPVDLVTLGSIRNPVFRRAVERDLVELHG
jgi:predicted nucleotidyltransferase